MDAFADHFSDCADTYRRFRPRYPDSLGDRLVALVDRARPGGDGATRLPVWEAGCGSGQLTELLASRFGRVTATDASFAQLALAPDLPGVHYHAARAEASALASGSAALAVAAQAAHWFDLPAWVAEVRRVVVPDGAVALISYGAPLLSGEPGGVLAHFHETTLSPHWPVERRWVDEGYRTLPFPFAEIPQPPLEVEQRWTLAELLGYVRSWSAVGRLREAPDGDGVLDRFEADLTSVWEDETEPRTVRWPLAIRAGTVSGNLA